MRNFGRDNKFGGPRGRSSFGSRDARPRRFGAPAFRRGGEMHDAVCAQCGRACQVPFLPMNGKPVFCNDCFQQNGGGKPPTPGAFGRASRAEQHSFSTPRTEQRSFSVPRAEQRSFTASQPYQPVRTEGTNQKFEVINAKLDQILETLAELTAKSTSSEPVVAQMVEKVAELSEVVKPKKTTKAKTKAKKTE